MGNRLYLIFPGAELTETRFHHACVRLNLPLLLYSVNFENDTQIKRYSAQILSYKIFSFCEQTLKIGANDASGQGLQFAL